MPRLDGAMPGDRQAAEDQIGRKLDRTEIRALETTIRAMLAEQAERLPALRRTMHHAWESYFAGKTPEKLAAWETAKQAYKTAGGRTND